MAAVIVHGGAYAIPDSLVEPKVEGCKRAAESAHKALMEGKSATDAGIFPHYFLCAVPNSRGVVRIVRTGTTREVLFLHVLLR